MINAPPINPLNPIVHFWLHHTAHCAEKIVSARLRAGSASAERVGQGEVGRVTGRVLCTWWLLSGCMATNSADYYMLVNEWMWSKSRDCLLRPEVDMGSVLESELRQKWR